MKMMDMYDIKVENGMKNKIDIDINQMDYK